MHLLVLHQPAHSPLLLSFIVDPASPTDCGEGKCCGNGSVSAVAIEIWMERGERQRGLAISTSPPGQRVQEWSPW